MVPLLLTYTKLMVQPCIWATVAVKVLRFTKQVTNQSQRTFSQSIKHVTCTNLQCWRTPHITTTSICYKCNVGPCICPNIITCTSSTANLSAWITHNVQNDFNSFNTANLKADIITIICTFLSRHQQGDGKPILGFSYHLPYIDNTEKPVQCDNTCFIANAHIKQVVILDTWSH